MVQLPFRVAKPPISWNRGHIMFQIQILFVYNGLYTELFGILQSNCDEDGNSSAPSTSLPPQSPPLQGPASRLPSSTAVSSGSAGILAHRAHNTTQAWIVSSWSGVLILMHVQVNRLEHQFNMSFESEFSACLHSNLDVLGWIFTPYIPS